MKAGILLHSTSLLEGDFFETSIIFITENNENGATGFVINKLFPRKFNELAEFSQSIPFPLYDGGPVDREHLFFIHRRPDLITGGALVKDDIYSGGDFKQAVKLLNNGTITGVDIKLFIGYCGWDAKELEHEIAEGSWLVAEEGNPFLK